MKLLMVEDEFSFADTVRDRLILEGYDVDIAEDGDRGYDLAMSETYDLIIMDGMLPGLDGLEIIAHMRNASITTPVLMLTARSELADRVRGLDIGADDYLTKTCEMDELLARIRALLRRNYGKTHSDNEYNDLILNKQECTVTNKETGKSVNMSGKEFQLLDYLFTNSTQVITREQITERIWGYNEDVSYNNVEVYITFLRKKFKHIGSTTQIKAVRGIGYRLEKE